MLKKILNSLFGNSFYAASQLIIIALISNLWGSTKLGEYILAIAITTPLFTLFNLGLRNLAATDSLKKYLDSQLAGARLFLSIICSLIIIITSKLTFHKFDYDILYAVTILKLIDSNSDILIGLWQRDEKFSKARNYNCTRSLLSIISIIAGYITTTSLTTSLYIASLACSLFYASSIAGTIYPISKLLSALSPSKKIMDICLKSFPLGAMGTLSALSTNIPRFIIEAKSNIETLANYSVIYQFVFVGTIIAISIGQAATPKLTQSIDSKNIKAWDATIKRLIATTTIISIAQTAILYFAGETIIQIVFGETIQTTKCQLIMIGVLSFFSYTLNILSYALQSFRAYKGIIKQSVAMLLFYTLLSYLLISEKPIEGAIIATTLYTSIYSISIIFMIKKLRKATQ